jgi:hypothetical protein
MPVDIQIVVAIIKEREETQEYTHILKGAGHGKTKGKGRCEKFQESR